MNGGRATLIRWDNIWRGSRITAQSLEQSTMIRTRMTLIGAPRELGIQSADKEGTLRRSTVVDIAQGGRSRLSCLGLGLVSERALSRLLGG